MTYNMFGGTLNLAQSIYGNARTIKLHTNSIKKNQLHHRNEWQFQWNSTWTSLEVDNYLLCLSGNPA